MNMVEAALQRMEQAEGWPAGSLWIASDASGNAAIWRDRGEGELLHCVGHVAGQHFTELMTEAALSGYQGRGNGQV
jgi:hypothetical protein